MIANVIVPVFIVLVVSFLIGKVKKINLKPLIDLSVYLLVPALVFTSILKEEFIFKDFSMLFLSSLFVILGAGLITYIFFKVKKIKYRGLYLPIMFMNTGNIGFPVALYAFGQAGLTQAVLYSTVGSLVIFSLGVYIAAKKMNFIEIFKLPLIYAAVFGILFAVFGINIPEVLFRPIDLIGQAAIPMQLIILGLSLSVVKVKCLKCAIYSSMARLGLGFVLALLFVSIFNVSGLTRSMIIVLSTMPSALFTIILSQRYRRNADMVASTVFVSTLLALITIPIVLWFVTL
ncbi:MAG: AEC family transporter [archaeon]